MLNKRLLMLPTLMLAASATYASGTIKVGILHSLSGTMAISETALKNTALMTIDEINAKGGVLGKKLQPVIVNPGSNKQAYAAKAKQLLSSKNVDVIFGCWTSDCRKAVLPVVEKKGGLLFYPVQYEGQEQSPNIYYTGAAPNQQAIPAVDYLLKQGYKRFILVGTDYIYPRTTNKILTTYLRSKKIKKADIGVRYKPFGHKDYSGMVAQIKRFSKNKKTAIISTINGDSNTHFYNELAKQGISATDVPVMAFSIGESEIATMNKKAVAGHYVAQNYFMSLNNAKNKQFIGKYAAWAKKNKVKSTATNDPMVATYLGIKMWATAVKKAGTTSVPQVKKQLNSGLSIQSPSGYVLQMDRRNHHLKKPVMIGKINGSGQFDIVHKTPKTVAAVPWSPYIMNQNGVIRQ